MTKPSVPTVMIVEDDLVFFHLMRRYVEKSGCRPLGTNRGKEALALAKKEMPTMIVLDIVLQETDGWEVLRALKGNPVTRNVPAVLCSALTEALEQEKRAAGYLRKPILYRDFVAALARIGITPCKTQTDHGCHTRANSAPWQDFVGKIMARLGFQESESGQR